MAKMTIRIKQFSTKFNILDPKVRARYKGLKGGRSSGKSWAVARSLVAISCQYYTFIVCGREIQKSLKESAYKLIVDTITSHGLTDDFEILRDEIRHKHTGSRFIFMGIKSNPAAIKSLEGAHIFWAEEANQLSQESWDLIRPTFRKKNSVIIATWNPTLPTDPVEKIFDPDQNPYCLTEHINYIENPFTSQDIIDEAELLKINDPESYSHIFMGAYAPSLDDTLIPLSVAQACYARPVPKRIMNLPIIGALDVARGDRDKNAIVIRQGDVILFWVDWHSKDMVDITNKFAEACFKYEVGTAVIDATNLGGGGSADIWKRIPTVKHIKLVEFMGGHAPSNAKYKNARAETWDKMYQHMKQGLSLYNMQWAISELPMPQKKHDLQGRLQLESKSDMISRGVKSPNCGDSLSMTYSSKIYAKVKTNKTLEDYIDD